MESKPSATTLNASLYTAVDQVPMMVHVTAPSTLPAGYVFDAHINDDPNKVFSCEVPTGGVVEGEVFLVPLTKEYDGPRIVAPTGHWKDGLCDCFNSGFCHPSFWCSCCCYFIALGQVMTRMQVTWLGGPGKLERTKHTFVILLIICIVYEAFTIFYNVISYKAQIEYKANHPDGYDINDPMQPLPFYYALIAYAFVIYRIVAICRTRKTMRQRYQIPEENCKGCEDCCCATWCTCCAVSQMLRHTGEYEHYPGVCCSKTGHPPGTPLVV